MMHVTATLEGAEDILALFPKMARHIKRGMADALNRGAQAAQVEAARAVASKTRLKLRLIKSKLIRFGKQDRATKALATSRLFVLTGKIPLRYYGNPRVTKKGAVRVGRKTAPPGSFVAPIRGKGFVMKRHGKPRLPIQQIKEDNPGILQITKTAMEGRGRQVATDRFFQQMRRVIGK